MFGSPPPRTMNEPITEARAMTTIAPSRIKIPPVRDDTNAAVGFSAIETLPRFRELYQNTIIKVLSTRFAERHVGDHTLYQGSPLAPAVITACGKVIPRSPQPRARPRTRR